VVAVAPVDQDHFAQAWLDWTLCSFDRCRERVTVLFPGVFFIGGVKGENIPRAHVQHRRLELDREHVYVRRYSVHVRSPQSRSRSRSGSGYVISEAFNTDIDHPLTPTRPPTLSRFRPQVRINFKDIIE